MTPRTAPDLRRSLVALGVALLFTAVALATLYTRDRPEFDWSNYVVGLLATAGLLGLAVVAATGLVPDAFRTSEAPDRTSDAVAWPGAFGAISVGLMIGVALDDSAATEYVAGLAVLLLSAVGWLVSWRGPFVVSGVLGLFVVYAQAFDDLVGLDAADDADDRFWPAALALVLFALVVTAASWFLPSRVVAGVTAGAIAATGLAALTGVLAITGAISAAFVGFDSELMGGTGGVAGIDTGFEETLDHITTDTWVTLLLALLLILVWTACAALTGAVGFRVLVVATAVAVTPLATVALRVDHPTWWGVVIGGVGGVVLLLALLQRDRPDRPVPPAQPVQPPFQPPVPPPSGPPPTQPLAQQPTPPPH